MNSTASKRPNKGFPQNNGNDRLSELPDSILLHILSFMPIVDAVRTVVIRRFGSLWTHLPLLQFVDSELPLNWGSGLHDDDNYTQSFASFVRNVLFLHKRVPIESFKLRLGHRIDFDDPDSDYKFFHKEVTAWIRSVIDRQVKDLSLDLAFGYRADGSILPQCVFTSQFLVVLKLNRFRINELRRVQMRSLTKLSLEHVVLSNEVLNKIILGCPSLQELHLLHVTGLDKLRFTAPNIRKLNLNNYGGLLDCPNLKFLDVMGDETIIKVVDVSSIHEVNIWDCCYSGFTGYLNKFSNAEVFRYFDERQPIPDQDFPQTRWKCLHINSRLHGYQLSAISRLLRSSPLVEELMICTKSRHWEDTCHKNLLTLELPSCMMQQLKTITLRGYKIPCHGLLRLAEFLLRSSVSLEKLVIVPSKCQSKMVYELKFVNQLLSFPRASSNARVIFASETCEKVESTGE